MSHQLSFDQITDMTLKQAMTATKLSEMLDCIRNLKLHAKTIERDLSNSFNENNESVVVDDFPTENILELAKQRSQNHRYILLNDFNSSTRKNKQKTSLNNHQQLEFMKCIIAEQPTALDAIYLESLLNPDQWQNNNEYLQIKPKDYLTKLERKRLNEILN